MPENQAHFEVIEDQPLKPKRKLKRKYRPLFGHVPWRWLSAFACLGLCAGITLTIALQEPSQQLVAVVITTTPVPVAINLDNATAVWMNEAIWSITRTAQQMAVATQNNLRLYNGITLARLIPNAGGDHVALAFSPDGAQLASLTSYPGDADGKAYAVLKIWDTLTGDLLHETRAHQGGLNSAYWNVALVYSSDGKHIATGAGDGYLAVWDAATLEKRTSISTLAVGTSRIAFNSEEYRLTAIMAHGYSSSASHWGHSVAVWDIHDLATPIQYYLMPINTYFGQWAALSGDGHYIAYTDLDHSTQANVIRLHDLLKHTETGSVTLEHGIQVETLALIHDGRELAFVQEQAIPSTESGASPIIQDSIQVIWWWHGKDGFGYQPIGERQSLGRNGADHLYLWYGSGSMGLDYVALDNNSLFRWNFANHNILAIGL